MRRKKLLNPFDSKEIIEAVRREIGGHELEGFLVGIHYGRDFSENDRRFLRKSFQYALTLELEKALGVSADYIEPDLHIYLDVETRYISFWIRPLYIAGRYNKYVRNIAQTTFYCPRCKGRGCGECNFTGKTGRSSVEELLGEPLRKLSGCKRVVLHGLGREDVDVRMLGAGRPFILELKNPRRRSIDLTELENELNALYEGRLRVSELRFADRRSVQDIKSKVVDKLYEAKVSMRNEREVEWLDGMSLVIRQSTPNRVMARRVDKIRTKRARILEIRRVSETEFLMKLRADSGLYVKEFITSDCGRTQPSLSSLLGCECWCEELDVLEVLM